MVFNNGMIPLNYVICDLAIPLVSIGVDFFNIVNCVLSKLTQLIDELNFFSTPGVLLI